MFASNERKMFLLLSLIFFHFIFPVFGGRFVVPPVHLPALYPPWAHNYWSWFAGGQQNQSKNQAMLDGYTSRGIEVGAIICDDRWQTGRGTFVWEPTRYPDPKAMVDSFHESGVRFLVWTTSVLNSNTPTYAFAKENNFFLNDGEQLTWFGGRGSWIDYFNPAAVNWWHQQQQDVIVRYGLDGWKCDGTDPMVLEFIIPHSSVAGVISERDYANKYYRDYFTNLRKFNPDSLIMARPVNDYLDFAPHDVMFAGWVGDNDPTFTGMKWALNDILHSGWRGYLNFGSDTGGYRMDGPKPLGRTKTLLLRWAQLNAFLPLFENGGDNEHRPWIFDQHANCTGKPVSCRNETVTIFRRFVNIHLALGPYLLSGGAKGFANNQSQVHPEGWDVLGLVPTSFAYRLGNPADIFVSPVTESAVPTPLEVAFPEHDDWLYWFGGPSAKRHRGGTRLLMSFPLAEFPAFVRYGAMIPLDLRRDTGLGLAALGRRRLSLVLFGLTEEPGRVDVHEWRGRGLRAEHRWNATTGRFSLAVSASSTVDGSGTIAAGHLGAKRREAEAGPRGLVVRVRGVGAANAPRRADGTDDWRAMPRAVNDDESALVAMPSGWLFRDGEFVAVFAPRHLRSGVLFNAIFWPIPQ